MSDPDSRAERTAAPSQEEKMAGLFAHLVLQHTQLGLMLLGKAPRPDSGETVRDLDHAQSVIDQLEMLEAKTRGNLSKEEEGLLRQSLMTLRLAFVEAVDAAPSPAPADHSPAGEARPTATAEAAPASAPEDSKKKFTKKY